MTDRNSQKVTHQDTEVGLIQSYHIQEAEDKPIAVEFSDEYSAVDNNQSQKASYKIGEDTPGGSFQMPNRGAAIRMSHATDGSKDPYSEFDDDDDKAAVGSGIVETNENYEDEDYDDGVDY